MREISIILGSIIVGIGLSLAGVTFKTYQFWIVILGLSIIIYSYIKRNE